MELKQTRLARLQLYIDSQCSGNAAEFSRRVKRSPQQIVDMLKGRKSFGEKIAIDFCAILGLPPLWFDAESPSSGLVDSEHHLINQFRRLPPEDQAKVLNLANGLVDIHEVTRSVKQFQDTESKAPRKKARS